MDLFFDFLKDILRGFIRAMSTFVFHEILFKNKKTTLRRSKHKGGSRKK